LGLRNLALGWSFLYIFQNQVRTPFEKRGIFNAFKNQVRKPVAEWGNLDKIFSLLPQRTV